MKAIRNISFLVLCGALILTRPVPLQACGGGSLQGEGNSKEDADRNCVADGNQFCESLCPLYCEQQPFDVIIGCENGHSHENPPVNFLSWGSCGCHNEY